MKTQHPRRLLAASLGALLLGLPEAGASAAAAPSETSVLALAAWPLETQRQAPELPPHLIAIPGRDASLQLIQFTGPITEADLGLVRGVGAEIVSYVPRNGYLVWADAPARAALEAFVAARKPLQFSAPLHPYYKLAAPLLEPASNRARLDEEIDLSVHLYRHAGADDSRNWLAAHSRQPAQFSTPGRLDLYAEATLSRADLIVLAQRPDVVWIEERGETEPFDEVQTQIVAGNFNGTQSGPSGPGYLAWLQGLGFSANAADYPIVDIIDFGIGNGTTASGDPTLHEFGSIAGPSRVSYQILCHVSGNGSDLSGHGHINASVAAGYDSRGGFPFQDGSGFRLGLGVNPFGRVGSSQVYLPPNSFNNGACGGDSGMLAGLYNAGARIANASWGTSTNGGYNNRSRSFDIAVRDADAATSGHQSLTLVVAAGNGGDGGVTLGNVASPASAKNVVAVGATENFRPISDDPCGFPASGADHAMDIASYSARGPAAGNRFKPEIVAPGTHIQGTASTAPGFDNSLACLGGFNRVGTYPPGQTTFVTTNGTSQAAPAVAGAMSLIYRWLGTQYGLSTPSPALLKAYLLAHTTYLTGASAGDTLPSNHQGFGMPNLNRAFESTPRQLLDQSILLDASGQSHVVNVSVADSSKPVRVVLVYTDAPGLANSSFPQVNDLDLTVTSGPNLYRGNVFSGAWSITGGAADANNNSEAVYLQPGISGALQITVHATAINGDGVPETGDATDQDFALVCYNCAAASLVDVWVDFAYAGPEAGTSSQPYNTLAEGVAALASGGILHIKPGTTIEHPTINQAMTIQAEGGLVRIGVP